MSGNPEPIALWPLGSTTLANEIKVGGTPEYQNQQAGLIFQNSSSHPQLSYFPVTLNGSNFIDLDVPITLQSPLSGSDFYFFFFLLIKISQSLQIFHYKTSSFSPSGITDLRLYMASNGIICKISYNDGTDETSSQATTTTNNVLHVDTWYRLGFGVDRSTANMIFRVYIDDQEALILYSTRATLDLDLPGTLRLGASITDTSRNVRGYVTCVLAFGSTNPGSTLDMLNMCESWNDGTTILDSSSATTVTANGETTSQGLTRTSGPYELSSHMETSGAVVTATSSYNSTMTNRYGYFYLLQEDVLPGLIPIGGVIQTVSHSACAAHCMLDRNVCFSFTLTKNSTNLLCTLFGDVTNVPRLISLGTTLYKMLHAKNSTTI